MLRLFTFLVATATVALGCSESFPEWSRGTNFSIIVRMDKTPLYSMTVILEPADLRQKLTKHEAVTDTDGVASFQRVPPGKYDVEASRLGVVVGPGTVVVHKSGSSEQIPVEWPGRPRYSVSAIAGQFQLPVGNQTFMERFTHPRWEPLASAELMLYPIDSEITVESTTTNMNGEFAFSTTQPGNYLLHIRRKKTPDTALNVDDYLVLTLDPASTRSFLRLGLDFTSCGMISTELR